MDENGEVTTSDRMTQVLEFCDLAEIVCEPDPEDPSYAGMDIEGTGVWVHESVQDHAIMLFLPLLDAELSPAEAEEGCRLLAERFPVPEEFDGFAAYDFSEFGRGGLLCFLPMPRRFSSDLFADAIELLAETIARISENVETA